MSFNKKFSNWTPWKLRNSIPNIDFPGVYIIAITSKRISDKKFDWIKEIKYVGMTNSITGLKGRLKSFDDTILGKRNSHGGADRVRYKYQDYDKLVKKTYVSVVYFECDVKSILPKDLNVMGDVVKFEYECWAKFSEHFNLLPEFNDKKGSPKYSHTIERKNKFPSYYDKK
tara:strand:+ start:1329 stop:1841 length:513 start_codon:yes stop_codon:yes gene_type:complete